MATPENLRIHPSSQFVYAFGVDNSSASAATEGFTIDPTSGALTPLAGSPFTSLPIVGDCKWDQGGGEAFCADAASQCLFGAEYQYFHWGPDAHGAGPDRHGQYGVRSHQLTLDGNRLPTSRQVKNTRGQVKIEDVYPKSIEDGRALRLAGREISWSRITASARSVV